MPIMSALWKAEKQWKNKQIIRSYYKFFVVDSYSISNTDLARNLERLVCWKELEINRKTNLDSKKETYPDSLSK